MLRTGGSVTFEKYKHFIMTFTASALLAAGLVSFTAPAEAESESAYVAASGISQQSLRRATYSTRVVKVEKPTPPKAAPKPKPKPERKAEPSRAITRTPVKSTGAYRGRYYDPRWEAARQCIVRRESGGNYSAKNRYSTAAGAYQFVIGTSNAVAKMMGKGYLVGTSARYWSKSDQDQAFWTLWNHGAGKSHWHYPPKPCW